MINSKNIIIASLLIIALSFVYYFIIFLPNKEKAERELKKEIFNSDLRFKTEQAQNKENNLNNCLAEVNKRYQKSWDFNCRKFALDGKGKSCILPIYLANLIKKSYREDQELCIKKYK